ncbi:MAG: precorrin-6y C5,15-methyltransferase (decarboxylating) subunit CbiE [Chloroflexota bacterium]
MTQETAADQPQASPILVVGLTAGGKDTLPTELQNRLLSRDLLIGGQRHLTYFPEFQGETVAIGADMPMIATRVQKALDQTQTVAVIASGDPLCYGIGATLRRWFAAELLEIIPAPTAFQLAFAALAEPWHEAALLSAHARPLNEVVVAALQATKAAILTDNNNTPSTIAQALLTAGFPSETHCAICENLGGEKQRIVHTTLDQVDREDYAPLNVFVVWNTAPSSTIPPGLPDEAFSTTAKQITKREIRLLSLAELALQPGDVMWDIGAGSGSVSIEAARAQPAAQVYAIEKREELCQHLAENLREFPAPNLHWFQGKAPKALNDWPDPHAVFVGGSGGHLTEIIEYTQQRLQPQGRLVINLATLENLQVAQNLLPEARLIQAQINRGVPILKMTRFEALNPIFIVVWTKA